MVTWKILSNYKVFGLADTVTIVTKQIKKQIGVNVATARRMALVMVRIALVKSINDGSFYAA